ncbi:type II secretion system F family protein [Agromyces humatus]|uniref:type II secretion system F family protein n=1 Tax=Agromyces humatus TaxID=279573 RepID=UPI0031DE7A5F
MAALVERLRAWRRRPDPAAEVDAIASITERVAVLLAAGVPASNVWRHLQPAGEPGSEDILALGGQPDPRASSDSPEVRRTRVGAHTGQTAASADAAVLAAAAQAAAIGEPVGAVIVATSRGQADASSAWPVLAAAWTVAAESGAPLAVSLRSLATVLRDEAQLRREVGAALAGPAASARLVMALPAIAVLFGAALGFDTVGVLFGNPLGLACLAVGALFLWGGQRWNRRLARTASQSRADAGLELELLAIAMSSGTSIERARDLARRVMREYLPHVGDGGQVEAVIELSARAGAPVAELLKAEAFRVRRAARADGAARAAALGVRLMLPLGVCVLPAFVLLGVAPLMISVISGTLGGAV